MAKPTGNPPGAPPIYTRELAIAVCERLALGESLSAICRDKAAGMPDRTTVTQWVVRDTDGFASRYAESRNIGLDVMADSLLEIADTPAEALASGGRDSAAVAQKRLQVDTRKWYLSKLAHKRYGDKLDVNHSGGISLTVVTGVPVDEGDDLV